MAIHRHHEDLASSQLNLAESTRVKYDVVAVASGAPRYYHMFLGDINIGFGEELTLVVDNQGTSNSNLGFISKVWELAH